MGPYPLPWAYAVCAGGNLLTADNLAELCRLPWFVEGQIPKEAREILVDWLEQEQPEILFYLRECLHLFLSQNPPPEDSAAHDDYAMNMALNEWLFTRDRRKKEQLKKDIATRSAAGQEADFIIVKVLEGKRGLLDFIVPNAWRRFVLLGKSAPPDLFTIVGIAIFLIAVVPAFGVPLLVIDTWKYPSSIRIWVRVVKKWAWIIPILLIACLLLAKWEIVGSGCSGEIIVYHDEEWCIETKADQEQFMEMQVLDTLSAHQIYEADRLKDSLLMFVTDSNSYLKNLAVGYFNAGVTYHASTNGQLTSLVSISHAPRAERSTPRHCPTLVRPRCRKCL